MLWISQYWLQKPTTSRFYGNLLCGFRVRVPSAVCLSLVVWAHDTARLCWCWLDAGQSATVKHDVDRVMWAEHVLESRNSPAGVERTDVDISHWYCTIVVDGSARLTSGRVQPVGEINSCYYLSKFNYSLEILYSWSVKPHITDSMYRIIPMRKTSILSTPTGF